MTTSILMYVYFDSAGNIKSISSDLNLVFAEKYEVTSFPLIEVEPFLTAKKNPFDYFVKVNKRSNIAEYRIIRKQSPEIDYTRTLDAYLTEVTTTQNRSATIIIENFIKNKEIRITINPVLHDLYTAGSDEEQNVIANFINTPSASLFFTKKKDPYFLIRAVSFPPRELFDRKIIKIPYTDDLSTASVFTRKIIDGYNYYINPDHK